MSLTSNKNYLQPTGFKFVVDRRNYPNLEFFAQSVTHPGASVNPTEVSLPRLSQMALAGDKITYSTLTLEVIIDEDMTAYKECQNWLERLVNTNQSNSSAGDSIPTSSDITLSILNSHNNKTVQISYKDCVPTDIGSFSLASNTGDVQYTTFSISFRFTSFEIV